MNDLHQIIKVDPSKNSLVFLANRIRVDNYRGIQLSQHNRYTMDEVIDMLCIMFDLIGTKKMQIRTTDLSKRPETLSGEYLYTQYTTIVNQKHNKGTQDSIRKNLFVDFHRMGIINRYSPDFAKLDAYERGTVKYVSLSSLGLELIDNKNNEFAKFMIFTRALDNLLKGFATDLLDIISELKHITMQEFVFFVSFLYQQMNNKIYLKEDILKLVNDFRSLSKFQRYKIEDIVKDICDPRRFSGNKVQKRDYHNWVNETQQIFTVLSMTAYYDYDRTNNKLILRINKNSLFEDDVKLKRSVLEKEKYFKEHKVEKRIGFELHHIVPLSWAESREEFCVLDNYKNLLYIDGYTHSKITQLGSKHFQLDIDNNYNVLLTNYKEDFITCYFDKNVKYSIDNRQIMLDYNDRLLRGTRLLLPDKNEKIDHSNFQDNILS